MAVEETYYCETCRAALSDAEGALALQAQSWVIAERGSHFTVDFCSYQCLRDWAEGRREQLPHKMPDWAAS